MMYESVLVESAGKFWRKCTTIIIPHVCVECNLYEVLCSFPELKRYKSHICNVVSCYAILMTKSESLAKTRRGLVLTLFRRKF